MSTANKGMPDERREELRFGAIAIKLGFSTMEQVKECVQLQAKLRQQGNPLKRLGEILLERGYLTSEQVVTVFCHQGVVSGHTQVSGYHVLDAIGQGTTGIVYKAIQLSVDRIVALKILSPRYAQDEAFRERFLREIRSVAKFNHPHIIQAFDAGESNGTYYFAMEYVDGPSVSTLLKEKGKLAPKQALDIVVQIAQALQCAHENKIVHRDVKPANIMLNSHSMAKLCDLGIAKQVDPLIGRSDETLTIMGTPSYISPEQVRGEPGIDIRADLYSLGATFYAMVTSEPPFKAEDAAAVMRKHLTEKPVPPRVKERTLSPLLNKIILKMLAKKREERYQTPAELLKDLEFVRRRMPSTMRLAGSQRAGKPGSIGVAVRLKHKFPR